MLQCVAMCCSVSLSGLFDAGCVFFSSIVCECAKEFTHGSIRSSVRLCVCVCVSLRVHESICCVCVFVCVCM